MADHPDVALLKRGYEAFNTADVATLSDIIAEDAVQHMTGNNILSGDHKGRDGVLAMYARIGEETGGTFRAEPRSFLTDGAGRVVVVHHEVGERKGKQLDSLHALVFTVRDGRIVDMHDTAEDLYAYDAFWS